MLIAGATTYSASERRRILAALSHDERIENLKEEVLRYIKHVANSSGVLDTKRVSDIFEAYKGVSDDIYRRP